LAQASKYKEDNIKDYLFHLICGSDVQTNYVVFPRDFASSGFFMNHTSSNKKKVNVHTSIAIHRNGPIILMRAMKRIKCGEELLYDYNA
jgi:SET domain-containing protein